MDTIRQTIARNPTTGILEALPGILIKAGELLAGMDMHGGDRSKVATRNLDSMGITKTKFSRWQRAAAWETNLTK